MILIKILEIRKFIPKILILNLSIKLITHLLRKSLIDLIIFLEVILNLLVIRGTKKFIKMLEIENISSSL